MQHLSSVEDYLSRLEAPDRAELEHVRDVIRTAVPDATESISYGMPAFKYKGKPLMYYAAFKDHFSVFPTSGPPEVLADKLKNFKTGKGTVQFTAENRLPDELIIEMLSLRISEIDG